MTKHSLSAPRIRAFLVHLGFSALVLLAFWVFVLRLWYPDELLGLQGGWQIFGMLIGIDVVLGPLLTLIVYRVGKRTLVLDLCVIVAIQLAAFGYGAWALSTQRPGHLVFLHDRFFVVSVADVPVSPREGASALSQGLTGPRPVFARLSFGAELQLGDAISRATEPPMMALLPEAYGPLSEGRARFLQLLEEQAKKQSPGSAGSKMLTVPVMGRVASGRAVIDVDKGELLRLE